MYLNLPFGPEARSPCSAVPATAVVGDSVFFWASIAAFPWTWLDPMFYFHGQLLVPKPIMLYPTRYSIGFPRLGFAMGR